LPRYQKALVEEEKCFLDPRELIVRGKNRLPRFKVYLERRKKVLSGVT